MTNHFSLGMTKATELTKAGKLDEATALIQSLLKGTVPETPVEADPTVIEGQFTRLDDAGRVDEPIRQHPKQQTHKQAENQAEPQTEKPTNPPRNRASLRETLRSIAAGGMPDHAPFGKAETPIPVGAQFVTLTHRNPQGQRDYKLYTPANRPVAPMPLIVMLHGCTQSPDDFATGTGMNALAEKHGFYVAYPAQPVGANANKCWNWFKPEDQARDRGEPAVIAGLVRDILRDHRVDPARVYIAGLSAGGAAAAIVATAYPELFSAAGVHSGLAVGAASDIPGAFSAMRGGAGGASLARAVPMIVIHGTADATVHPRNGKAVADQMLHAFDGLQATARKGVSANGRAYRKTSHALSDGRSMVEYWEINGAGHAWAGGHAAGSFTDPTGPDASAEMLRFFLQHQQG